MYNSSKRLVDSVFGGKGSIDDMFDSFFSRFDRMGTPMNLIEEKDGYIVELSAVGLRKDDISVKVEGDKLVVKGSSKGKDNKDGRTFRREFEYGKINREIEFPVAVDLKNATAKLKDGLLTITVLKSGEEVGPSTINID